MDVRQAVATIADMVERWDAVVTELAAAHGENERLRRRVELLECQLSRAKVVAAISDEQ